MTQLTQPAAKKQKQHCYDREDDDDNKDVYDDDDGRNDNNCLIIVNTVNLVELVRHN